MYTTIDFKSKKALKEAVAAHLKGEGPPVTFFSTAPSALGLKTPTMGRISIEGPQFPKPHRWYAECYAEDGAIVSVK